MSSSHLNRTDGVNLSLQDLERIAILAKLSSIIMHFLVTLLMPMMGVPAEEIRQGSRVIAGEDANYKSYPFYGLVVYKSELIFGAASRIFCGSSLISDYFFLTAAHCMSAHKQPHVYGILMGVRNRCQARGYETMLDVVSIYLPPGYTFADRLTSDIALMKTKHKVRGYNKILLPRNPIFTDKLGIVIGFGSTIPALPGGEQFSCTLKQSPQKILRYSQCHLTSEKTFCAIGTTSNDSSICGGDSGSPWITRKVNRKVVTYEITGIVSAAAPWCLASNYPNILTHVHEHLAWINGIIA